MYEFTKQVAGDLADVENLIPPGIEAHDWEPTPQDMAGISDADVLVYNGAGMEGWVDQVLESIQGTGVSAIEASKGIEIMEGTAHSHDHGEEGITATMSMPMIIVKRANTATMSMPMIIVKRANTATMSMPMIIVKRANTATMSMPMSMRKRASP